ncbi:uncharacterized protein LOC143186696 [Calliopsis andreniformis]|uniref:uncharacterized protein LOC143186696 n=1 Tax=Calliopsis andreniformis TaxID=337506 RepID=UPI003FCD93CD
MKSKEKHNLQKQQLVKELHALARRNFPRRRVVVHGYDGLWQADVVEMHPYSRFNQGYYYILSVIDALNKHVWAVPLKTKNGIEVAKAFANIIRDRCQKNLQTNQGKEFYNVDNMRKHRTIGMRPCSVTLAITDKLLKTVYSDIKIAAPLRFKVGDSARVNKYKTYTTVFDKGYTPNWTAEIFKIIKIQTTNPVTYLLQDLCPKPIAGELYEYELQRITNPDVYLVEKALRKKDDKLLSFTMLFYNALVATTRSVSCVENRFADVYRLISLGQNGAAKDIQIN